MFFFRWLAYIIEKKCKNCGWVEVPPNTFKCPKCKERF